ncbi:MAG: DUF983 domain-containing protein [Saprospiraceae bacterium]
MLRKGQKLYSIIYQKCPRCHEGDLWKKRFFASLPQLIRGRYNMYERCPKCDLKYEQEPGFWWGAMYIAYALSSGALLITAAISKFYCGLNLNQTMLVVLIVAVIGFLYNARIARAIYINIFVKYQPKQSNGI